MQYHLSNNSSRIPSPRLIENIEPGIPTPINEAYTPEEIPIQHLSKEQ